MLAKALLNSLKGNNGIDAINVGFDLIPDNKVYLIYSMKFEINRTKFKTYAEDYLSTSNYFNNPNQLQDYLNILQPWYEYFLDNKSLFKHNTSLKSDVKKWFKNNISQDLKGFDRFFELTLKVFNEAFNVYTVVLYEPEAIKDNKNFSDDRGSCYIKSRSAYLEALVQARSYYTLIYKNNKPITRVWLLCSKDYGGFVIFNPYGYKFKNLSKFFFDEGEYKIASDKLEEFIGVYVNNDIVLMTNNSEYDDFIYSLSCPSCGSDTTSDQLKWADALKCDKCDGVYSEYYDCYIPEEDAYYSYVHNSYIYYDDSVYSYFYDDRIIESLAYKVYNIDIDDIDYVLQDDAVYSVYYDRWLIKNQCVYSEYYGSYLLRDDDGTVYSKYLNDYLDRYDEDIIDIGYDYIPSKYLDRFIEIGGIYYQKLQMAYPIKLRCDIKKIIKKKDK